MEIRYHGHSCFELNEGETSLIVDPFPAPEQSGRRRDRG